MNKIILKSEKEYKAEGYNIFYFNEELFLADTENFNAIIKYLEKNYAGKVLDTLTAADVDIRQIGIDGQMIVFKDNGESVIMVNLTEKSGGVLVDIYDDLGKKIAVKPKWLSDAAG